MSGENIGVETLMHGKVLLARVKNPPVNALSHSVRVGLLAALEQAQADPAIAAMLIIGSGPGFIAGADIREFGKPAQEPGIPQLCNLLEASSKPVLVAIHGAALGGGLEVAMSAHYRAAQSSARLGLPEVNLGLLPGAGGTQRAPRLMGAKAAAELMLSGQHLSAQTALHVGLIDHLLVGQDIEVAALEWANSLLTSGLLPRPTCAIAVQNPKAALVELDELARQIASKNAALFAPPRIVKAVRAAVELPFKDGLAQERELFLQCLQSPQREALIHAFFAERAVSKIPEATAAQPRAVQQIAVIGGGSMGAGISVALLNAGLQVLMIERDADSLARGRANIEKVYDRLIGKVRMTDAGKQAIMAGYSGSTAMSDVAGVDLVIEAVFEEMTVKQAVFRELDRFCKPGAVLATNTSYLDVNAIAAVTSRPQDVIGLHFFSPANIMKLLEIVVPAQTSADVVATAFALAKKLRKVAVRAGVCDGFIGNRILAACRQVADHLMEDGASPYEIDAALRNFGYPMGLFEVSDLAGGDIGWAVRKRRAADRKPGVRYVEIADRLCEKGWFGQKTGRGFYLYPQGSRTGQPDPDVLAIIAAERARKGITPRVFSEAEILQRLLTMMVNEGARIVEEGIALRPLDVDVILMLGYGFPRFHGGPMKWADMQGLASILASVESFATEDPEVWQPAVLLQQLVKEGKNFASLNGQ